MAKIDPGGDKGQDWSEAMAGKWRLCEAVDVMQRLCGELVLVKAPLTFVWQAS
jgi:hypothetical protein